MKPLIDYQKIVDAKKYYEYHGFREMDVPWILEFEAYAATIPSDRKEFYALGGYLNASGEQSFLQLLLSGTELKKNLCITPCFRDEPVINDLHYDYFFKLELIDMDVSTENLKMMIGQAEKFFNGYMDQPVKIMATDGAGRTYDIVDGIHGIELGSYGIREYKGFRWIYGTGIALPRFDVALSESKLK